MNTILILLTILILWFIWSIIWVKTLNDFTKAQLLRLDRETSVWFKEKGYGIDHIAYKQLQKEIESFIFCVEDFSLFSYICFNIYHKKVNKTLKYPVIEENFSQEIRTEMMKVRSTISAYFTWKMLLGNMITFTFFLVCLVGAMVIAVCRLVKNLIIGKCHISFQHVSFARSFLLALFIGIISLPFISKGNIQGYSDNIIAKCFYKQKTV